MLCICCSILSKLIFYYFINIGENMCQKDTWGVFLMHSISAPAPVFSQVVHLITVNQTWRRKKCWHFSVWPSDTGSHQTAETVSEWLTPYPRQTGCLPGQIKSQIQILSRLILLKKSRFVIMKTITWTLHMFLRNSSCCISDFAQSFCGCYLGQSGAGWRPEETQTGKKLM